MAINLQKGQGINLDKAQYDLSQVTVGLGWDVRKEKKGFLASLVSSEKDYDLDAVAFLLDEKDKVTNLGIDRLQGSDVIFFNNLRHPTGTIWHTGDNRVGGTGGERDDDEQICVKLNAMDRRFHKILFLVSIYQGTQNQQHFGMVDNAFIRLVDAKGREMARYDLSKDPASANMRTMIFGEVVRDGSGWKFNAIGKAEPTDSFVDILKRHM